jgi:hypothetical protein
MEDVMTEIFKKIILSSFLILIMTLFVITVTGDIAVSAENFEESSDTVMPSDEVITGKVDDYSDRLIYVDGFGYRLCKNVKIFNTVNKMITMEDFNEVEEVKVFSSNGCARKIKILHFAE